LASEKANAWNKRPFLFFRAVPRRERHQGLSAVVGVGCGLPR